MQEIMITRTKKREELVDITKNVSEIVSKSNTKRGICNLYVQGATAAIMIQENWDESVQEDVIDLLKKIIPKGVWKHDLEDGNGDSHLKSGLIGPSETIPIINSCLGLSTWQNIFLCEFDGPRKERKILVTIIND